MNRVNPVKLMGFLVAVLLVMGAMALLKGGVFIARHEADTLHLMQIVMRMDAGQWPHLDFMTPLGVLAFAPIVFFVGQGTGMGHALLFAQIAMAMVLLPALWWIGISRLRGWLSYLFGTVVIVLVTALVFGGTEPALSVSMYYNRWAWAIAFVAIATAVLPAIGSKCPLADGVIIGLAMAALVLIKATYFVAFAPAVIVALVMQKSWRTLGVALLAGMAVAVLVTLVAGLGFWQAYIGDLLLVTQSTTRPRPGLPLPSILFAPAYIGATAVAVLTVVLLAQSGQWSATAALALLVPAFVYVTYQNFGNDPQWLSLLAILILMFRPDIGPRNRWGWDIRKAMNFTAVVALALALPSVFNMATSPYRQLGVNAAWYEPMLPRNAMHSDLKVLTIRSRRVDARVPLDGTGAGLEHLRKVAMRPDKALLLGEPLVDCQIKEGLPGWIDAIAQDLERAGLSKGKRLFVADSFSSHWMFGDLQPLEHGAPWYYGGLPGVESASYLLVPLCPAEPRIRKKILNEFNARDDISLTEIRRTPLYILLDIAQRN